MFAVCSQIWSNFVFLFASISQFPLSIRMKATKSPICITKTICELWYFAYGSYLCTNFGTHGENCGISSSTHTNSRNSAEWLREIGISPTAHTSAQTSARMTCSFLYPFQRMRKRKLFVCTVWYFAYGSYQFKKLGRVSLPFYIQSQPFLLRKGCDCI